MTLLITSILAPIAGTFLYSWFHDSPKTARMFDLCMYVAVPILIVCQVMEHGWVEHGLAAFGVLALGLAVPFVLERVSHSLATHTDNLALIVGFSGLALHVLLEGAALVTESMGFKAAVILHRLFVGMMVWWLLRPRHGFRIASLGIIAIVILTVAGYAMCTQWFDGGTELYQAFVGGSLLHVVFHQSRHDHTHTPPSAQ